MGQKTSIEWTTSTWSPTRGCSRISPGCERCYAEQIAGRFSKPGLPFHGFAAKGVKTGHRATWTGKVSLVEDQLDTPLHWKKPRMIFLDSMSDLFHEKLSIEDIALVFAIMAACSQHTFQCLTKRAERLPEVMAALGANDAAMLRAAGEDLAGCTGWCYDAWKLPLKNVWIGVSVEDQQRAKERIPCLLQTPAAIRWLSVEPLLEEVDLLQPIPSLDGGNDTWLSRLDWVVCGGESGRKARPFELAWARSIRDQCAAAHVPFFLKQLGAEPRDPDLLGIFKDRSGGDEAEWPLDLQGCRAWPTIGT